MPFKNLSMSRRCAKFSAAGEAARPALKALSASVALAANAFPTLIALPAMTAL